MTTVELGSVTLGGDELVLISGPCVVEQLEVMQRAAEALQRSCARHGVGLIFKASYEKDNRTTAEASRGPGLEQGLEILRSIRDGFGLPVTTDVHRVSDLPAVAQSVDLVQIPAFLCRQTSLLEAVARSGVPLNIKKGQFASVATMAAAVHKVRRAGARAVVLTERGNSFGYDRVVCDLTNLAGLRRLGCPVVLDAGHPAADAREIPLLARAGVAAGADALFIEAHPQPDTALCDGARSLPLSQLDRLLPQLKALWEIVREARAE